MTGKAAAARFSIAAVIFAMLLQRYSGTARCLHFIIKQPAWQVL
jgi:hypothetical protein